MHRQLCLVFLAALTAVTVAVGTVLIASANTVTVVYVGAAEDSEIYVLKLDWSNGDLALVEKVPIPGIEKPGISTPMSISPDRRFLYFGTRGEPKIVAGFAIDQRSGKLTHIVNSPLADSMAYISTDRTGRYLFGASFPGHKVTVNPIGPPGIVQPPQQVLNNYPNAHSVVVDAANRHVLVATRGDDRIHRFEFDVASGELTPVGSPVTEVSLNAGPRHITFHPNGMFVYVVGELDAVVYTFAYDAVAGGLRFKQAVNALPPDFQGKPSAADLHITPDGKFLYVSERTSSTLAGFAVHPVDGTLTRIRNVPTEKIPRGFNIDSSGRYLFAVGQQSHALSSYAIDPATGVLARLKRYRVGKNPNWIEIVDLPYGKTVDSDRP